MNQQPPLNTSIARKWQKPIHKMLFSSVLQKFVCQYRKNPHDGVGCLGSRPALGFALAPALFSARIARPSAIGPIRPIGPIPSSIYPPHQHRQPFFHSLPLVSQRLKPCVFPCLFLQVQPQMPAKSPNLFLTDYQQECCDGVWRNEFPKFMDKSGHFSPKNPLHNPASPRILA